MAGMAKSQFITPQPREAASAAIGVRLAWVLLAGLVWVGMWVWCRAYFEEDFRRVVCDYVDATELVMLASR
jgi:hypothetical protein